MTKILYCSGYEESDENKKYYIEYDHIDGSRGHVVLFGGFLTNKDSEKAIALEKYCKENDIAFTRFSYFGHGESFFGSTNQVDDFAKCNISIWKKNCLDVLNNLVKQPAIIVGSSMGGWLMLLIVKEYPEMIKGLIGVAAAPDFAKRLMRLSEYDNMLLERDGVCFPLQSVPHLPISKDFIEDACNNSILDHGIDVKCPVVLLVGTEDQSVPYAYQMIVKDAFINKDKVSVEVVQGAEHAMNDDVSMQKTYEYIEKFL